ncbi:MULTISPECIES: glycosyltransferase family 1 protein [unclassified Sphingomonas]|uniref:glycosyltransferase family 4 protein n=1 Tax=unclassified Sphingomonas TaxID=196159 RepID=UPI0028678032|nr:MULTISPECIES: glycosyltransferase family 1 protein [unclassified Sphingomonas]MDR6116755.1 hypothetical protein [Sphingomonas sp. SORGH_AS_0789]MDR6151907.1 hypothetical protein [Sphingomonas sp. SORGH_AS_0742]
MNEFPHRDVPICLDGRMLGEGGTGVSTYARALAAAIRQISDQPCRLLARCAGDPGWRKWGAAWIGGTQRLRHMCDADGRVLEGRDIFRRAHVHFSMHRRFYSIACDGQPGIMHWTYPVPMRMEGWINLYTVHDTIPLDHPDLTPIDPRRHRAVLDAIAATGDGITTVTQDARTAIMGALDCASEFVIQTSQPVDAPRRSWGPLPAGLLSRGYLLVVGSIEPRKNLMAILTAYRRSDTCLPLVIVGPDGWRAPSILKAMAATSGVIHLPYVERDVLLGLIAQARALLFASLAEGFGLPIVEAMALGTPVLTSNRGAMAEVAGEAALKVDPTDVGALSDGIARLVNDDVLHRALIDRGTRRATAFSTDAFAARLTTVYEDALRRRSNTGNWARTLV